MKLVSCLDNCLWTYCVGMMPWYEHPQLSFSNQDPELADWLDLMNILHTVHKGGPLDDWPGYFSLLLSVKHPEDAILIDTTWCD